MQPGAPQKHRRPHTRQRHAATARTDSQPLTTRPAAHPLTSSVTTSNSRSSTSLRDFSSLGSRADATACSTAWRRVQLVTHGGRRLHGAGGCCNAPEQHCPCKHAAIELLLAPTQPALCCLPASPNAMRRAGQWFSDCRRNAGCPPATRPGPATGCPSPPGSRPPLRCTRLHVV